MRKNILDTDLYCLTAEKFSLGRSNIAVVEEMLASGIKLIQYREKEKYMGEKYEECLAIRELTKKYGATFIVNDHIDLALAVSADGVHVGQEDMPVEVIRKLIGQEMIIGLSTHSKEQAEKAVILGVDYIGVGPIYATQTKDDVCAAVGLAYLDYVVQHIKLPFVVIGGIKEHNIVELAQHGAKCFALVTEIVGAADIAGTIKNLRAKIA